MKVTFDLPDGLLKEVKLRALHDGRKLKDSAAQLLRAGLHARAANGRATAAKKKVRLPLIKCLHPATAATEITPRRVADLLLKQETSWHADPGR